MTVTLNNINEFLKQEKWAIVGLSRNPKKFSAIVYTELKNKGRNIVAVNPLM